MKDKAYEELMKTKKAINETHKNYLNRQREQKRLEKTKNKEKEDNLVSMIQYTTEEENRRFQAHLNQCKETYDRFNFNTQPINAFIKKQYNL